MSGSIMGGLFGVVGRASQGAQLRAMGARLRHRGRDLSVACPAPEVALGSLHDAAGPGLASLERLAAVCDATIYDAPAPLTGSAEPAGAGSGGSPAARLLALHEQEGLAAIERVDGDFASAIVDGQR